MNNFKLQKVQNVMLRNNNYRIVLIYFSLLFLLDYSGMMDYFNQNIIRRCINMARRRDFLTCQDKLNPFVQPMKGFVSQEDIKLLQSIKIPPNKDMFWFSRKNTTTHQCCKNFSVEEANIIKTIKEKCRKQYEKQIGKKLYNWTEEKSTIYVYHGKNSQHLWHVDPRNVNHIYNLIVCIDRKGNISPFQHKDKDLNIHTVELQPGDGILFNGGTTIHQVPPNDDENSVRTVMSIAFTSDEVESKKIGNNNLCTYIEGGNNYTSIATIFGIVLLLNYLLSKLSNVNKLDNIFLVVSLIITLIVARFLPLIYLGIGSGRASSISYNLMLLLAVLFSTCSIKGGSLFFMYFVLSEVFFKRSKVEYE